MKKVKKTSQIKVKTKNQNIKKSGNNFEDVKHFKSYVKNPLTGKTGGKGLDDYSLDVMTLE